MKTAHLTACLVFLGFLQARPNFSGTWVFDPDHSPKTQPAYVISGNGATSRRDVPLTPAFGSEFTATQDQKTLTIRRTLASTTPVTYTGVYALDGSETRNKAPSSTVGQPGIETASTTAWDGNKLVITIWRPAQPGAGKQRRVLRLESDGTLMVETTTPGPNGAPPSSTTTAYKRARAK